MRIAEYLQLKGITPADFAAIVGVTPQAMSRYMLGQRLPRGEVQERIVEASDKKITLDGLHAPWRERRVSSSDAEAADAA